MTSDSIRRRRECQACSARFTTHERLERRMPWVVKKDGTKELFSTDKVLNGLRLACRKRPIGAEGLEDLVRLVEDRVDGLRLAEVQSAEVGEAVMLVLRDVDEVAYVRFASVYRAFENVDQFVETIRPLREQV
jgi:transcriptional repressor NrdR